RAALCSRAVVDGIRRLGCISVAAPVGDPDMIGAVGQPCKVPSRRGATILLVRRGESVCAAVASGPRGPVAGFGIASPAVVDRRGWTQSICREIAEDLAARIRAALGRNAVGGWIKRLRLDPIGLGRLGYTERAGADTRDGEVAVRVGHRGTNHV